VTSFNRFPGHATIAIDTEFQGPSTLTVQAAARIGPNTIAVQIYRSASVPEHDVEQVQDHAALRIFRERNLCAEVLLRPMRLLPFDLSPAVMARDLFGATGVQVLSLREGNSRIDRFAERPEPGLFPCPINVVRNSKTKRWVIPYVELTLVGHFLRADFARIHGQHFIFNLKDRGERQYPKLAIEGRKLHQFLGMKGRRDSNPVLEYIIDDGQFLAIRVRTRDTNLPFGSHSLDHLARTFAGLHKSDILDEDAKQNMLATFQERPLDALAYAAADAVTTLLVYEGMQSADRKVYAELTIPESESPAFQSTTGARVAAVLQATARTGVASGSSELGSRTSLRELMRRGGVDLFQSDPEASKFGARTAVVHGGLLLNRSPTKLWHEGIGQLADIDMIGCYGAIAGQMNVYWGRPVILEPGAVRRSLKDAVAVVQRLCDRDGWMIRVTGPIARYPNALIPSTEDALTLDNVTAEKRRQRRRAATQQAIRRELAEDPNSLAKGAARLYAARIDSGVVCAATWDVIQILPEEMRSEYEALVVDSIVFYPRAMAASNGPQYDQLVQRLRRDGPQWQQELDESTHELVQRSRLDNDYVSLRYPLHEYMARFAELRKEAREAHGKGSAAETAYKVLTNSTYGVLASPYFPVNNFVAANIITATARATAFLTTQALNAIQTITDGCTYRRDQIPAIGFEDCLKVHGDYPIRRAEGENQIRFLDPDKLPTDDAWFTDWYRHHVRRFFKVPGPELDAVLRIHGLEHKRTDDRLTFDGLAVDGAGNHAKAMRDTSGNYRVVDFKARGYGKRSKKELQDWMLDVYRKDRLEAPAPLVHDVDLLSFNQAAIATKELLFKGYESVLLPLGFGRRKPKNYKIIKASAFIFTSPDQRAKILKQVQRFETRVGSGLEVLALRHAYKQRKQGSVEDILDALYELVRSGDSNLTKALNTGRLAKNLKNMLALRRDQMEELRREASEELWRSMLFSPGEANLYPTSLIVTRDEEENLKPDRHLFELRLPLNASYVVRQTPELILNTNGAIEIRN
jgi:hypothetical protein